MKLWELIKRKRKASGISQESLADHLAAAGFNVSRTTISGWEQGKRANDLDWNPDFIRALATTLNTDAIELLRDLGFPVVPDGFTFEDVQLAFRLREIPDLEDRKRATRILNAVLDEFRD